MVCTPLLLLSCLHLAEAMSSHTILVSGYNHQITSLRINQTDSVLEKTGVWDVDKDMTWLQVEGNVVYAAHEVQSYGGVAGGAISRWNITKEGIDKLQMVILPTVSPAHILVSLEMELAFVANYGGHSFTVVRMDGGRLLGDIAYHEIFGAGCRDASHPHQTVLYGSWVWVVDLGCDTIWHYKVESKQIVKLGETPVIAGCTTRRSWCSWLQSIVEVYRYR